MSFGETVKAVSLFTSILFPGLLAAQDADSLRSSYLLPIPRTAEIGPDVVRSSPGSSSGTPTAYGSEWGDVFVGAGFQNRMRYVSDTLPLRQRADGAVVAGFGLGNSRKTLGLELAYTSFSTIRSGFFHHSSVSFKVHRALPGNLHIAWGWEDWIRTTGLDGGSSMYGVLSSYLPLRESSESPFSSITLSAGAGGGRFQTEKAINAQKHGANAFGSVGVRILSPISVFADWTGQDLSLGASIVPFTRIPLFITPAFADVTGSAGDGARFVMGVGLDFTLF